MKSKSPNKRFKSLINLMRNLMKAAAKQSVSNYGNNKAECLNPCYFSKVKIFQ